MHKTRWSVNYVSTTRFEINFLNDYFRDLVVFCLKIKEIVNFQSSVDLLKKLINSREAKEKKIFKRHL